MAGNMSDTEQLKTRDLKKFAEKVGNDLILAEIQLKDLKDIVNGYNHFVEEAQLAAIMRENSRIEKNIPMLNKKLMEWGDLILSRVQQKEVNRLINLVNRLTVVNSNIVQHGKTLTKTLARSEKEVDKVIKRMMRAR